MTTVLVVDDDPKIVMLVAAYLEREGWEVEAASDGLQALRLLRSREYDAVVLDVMLPRLDGIGVAEEARRASTAPILMLTALGTVPDRVRGLEAGADDYLPKPFAPAELVARLRSLLRRAGAPRPEGPLTYLDLTLDLERHRAVRGEERCDLTRLEFDLLVVLVLARGRVLSRAALIDAVAQDQEEPILERSIDAYVGRLRRKLGDVGNPPRYVETVRGLGYRALLDA
ncbi:MAG: response regulator transcription factor [Candidatus Dormibacteraceae bacterium]